MPIRRSTIAIGSILALSFVLAACGGADRDRAGEEPADGVRTIEISSHDDLTFDPASVEVQVGETVRFVVTNEGQAVHDFFVGTEEEQTEHKADMGGMDHDADPATDALTLDPGETDQLTMTLDTPGTLLYGCHQPGHYEGGMVGTIAVS